MSEATVATVDLNAEMERMRAELAAEMEKAKALTAALERKAEIRSEVSEALRLQQEETRRKEFGKLTPYEAPPMPPKPDAKLFAVKLERNYTPRWYYEVVGYHKEAVVKKLPSGQMAVVEPAEFIENEKKPPHIGGVGFPTKIWAGTVIRVVEAEARDMRRSGIGALDFD